MTSQGWAHRVDLAACFRLADRFGFSDIVWNHISARAPGDPEHLLTCPFGHRFDEVRASDIIEATFDGRVVAGAGAPATSLVAIHPAIYRARPELRCIVHTHTRAGMAVSSLARGLVPVVQDALLFWRRIGYHEFEGLADGAAADGLVRDLGPHRALVLRNHGLLTAGATIGEAFMRMYFLERACQVQLDAFAAGAELRLPPDEICERTARQIEALGPGRDEWPALLRLLDRDAPDYRS